MRNKFDLDNVVTLNVQYRVIGIDRKANNEIEYTLSAVDSENTSSDVDRVCVLEKEIQQARLSSEFITQEEL